MHVIIDNTGEIYVNNNKIANYGGGWQGNPGRFTINLKEGINDIKIIAWNVGGGPNPAGLLVSVFDESNNILFNTTNDWKIGRAHV